MKNKILIICLLASTLSSCHIYRAYERPSTVMVSDSLYRQPVAAEDTTSLASLSWKELFTDPQLQQLIETGLAHNTDLSIARLKVKEAEALLMTSRLSYLPSVSLTPQGTLTSLDGNKPSKTYNLAVSADWEIDLFGKLLNAKRGAQATLEQSEAYRQAVQTQLVATIANSYYTLLMLDKQLDITPHGRYLDRKPAHDESLEAGWPGHRNGRSTDRSQQTGGRCVRSFHRTPNQ